MTRAGFSLVELVIALSIASLLSVMLIGGYALASRAWNRAASANDQASEVYAAQSVLRRCFAGLSLESEKTAFAGTAASLSFDALIALPGNAPAHTSLEIAAGECPQGKCLLLLAVRPEWRQGVSAPLARGIKSLKIAYRDKGKHARWRDTWAKDAGTPSLVRIDVIFASKRSRWPTLYLAPPSQT